MGPEEAWRGGLGSFTFELVSAQISGDEMASFGEAVMNAKYPDHPLIQSCSRERGGGGAASLSSRSLLSNLAPSSGPSQVGVKSEGIGLQKGYMPIYKVCVSICDAFI